MLCITCLHEQHPQQADCSRRSQPVAFFATWSVIGFCVIMFLKRLLVSITAALLVILELIGYSDRIACLQNAHYRASLKAPAVGRCGVACRGGSAERAYVPFTRMRPEY